LGWNGISAAVKWSREAYLFYLTLGLLLQMRKKVLRCFRLTWWIFSLMLLCKYVISGNCRLPESWKGKWFQSGIPNPILIDSKSIEGKGTCYESSGDKFLFVEK
jgi:hypothetical protein